MPRTFFTNRTQVIWVVKTQERTHLFNPVLHHPVHAALARKQTGEARFLTCNAGAQPLQRASLISSYAPGCTYQVALCNTIGSPRTHESMVGSSR